jgi:hypothetical protein
MKLLVLHDGKGRILSLGKPELDSRVGFTTGIRPQKGQQLLEVELPKELEGMDLAELHRRYRIDSPSKSLMPKTG